MGDRGECMRAQLFRPWPKSEVNLVTGHVLCVEPRGAPVAPTPKAEPCKTGHAATDTSNDADFAWRPTCSEEGNGA